MEALLRNYFWMIRAAGVGLGVAFLASAVMTHYGAQKLIDDLSLAALADEKLHDAAELVAAAAGDNSESGEGKAKSPAQIFDWLTSHNLFCPDCKPAEVASDVDSDEPDVGQSDPSLPPPAPGDVRSSLPYALQSTMEAERPRDSMAVLFHLEQKTAHALAVGDELEPGAKLIEVERGRVVLARNSRREYIDMHSPPAPAEAEPKAEPEKPQEEPKPVNDPNSRSIDGAAEAINCNGNTCTVSKAFRDKILSNLALLNKQARVVTAMRDGEPRGFKFYGIRPDSLPKLFGMKNGDMVTHVNGQELKSGDELLGLYTKLRRAPRLSVTIERRGEQINQEIIFE